jgi:bifunctional pyridoxal-dependent enzyme with beta-cystathionase and maltose regulon repressor activities
MTSVIIEFVPSIVTAISYCIMALTDLNDKVLIFTPVYAAYINQIIALNRQV